MNLIIRPFTPSDIEDIVQLSLRAWEPVFHSFEQVLGRRIFLMLYPDWPSNQRAVVEKICLDEVQNHTFVAEVDEKVVGFISFSYHAEERAGEVELLAVDPQDQNQGIGTALNKFVLEQMRQRGWKLAVVGTGGDSGHAPARRCYEKAGFTGLPLVRYYQALGEE